MEISKNDKAKKLGYEITVSWDCEAVILSVLAAAFFFLTARIYLISKGDTKKYDNS